MNKILALREKRANLWNETKAFLDSHRGEDGYASGEIVSRMGGANSGWGSLRWLGDSSAFA